MSSVKWWPFWLGPHMLTHCDLVTPYGDIDLGKYWFRLWFIAWRHKPISSLHWCHNDHDGVSSHQPHGCLLNRLFRRRSKKTSKLRVTGLCEGNSPGPVNSPHKGPVTRKMFPFDDVIMWTNAKSSLASFSTFIFGQFYKRYCSH